MTATENFDLPGWIPVDVVIRNGEPAVEWIEMAGVVFEEPFFNQTVERVRKSSATSKAVFTDFAALLDVERTIDGFEPSGLIFHSSRCGSTLVSNACRKLEGSIVMSEPPPLDKIITRFLTDIESSAKELLYLTFARATAAVLGQRRSSFERNYFIKFAAPSTLQFQRLRRIWPKIPTVMIYRDPVETIVSNLANVPEWMERSNEEAAAKMIGVNTTELGNIDAVEYCARAIGRFYESVRVDDANLLICNYEELSADKLVEIVQFFNVLPSNAEEAAIRNSVVFHSKNSAKLFVADAEFKRASAPDRVKCLAEQWATPAYERLLAGTLASNFH